MRKRTITNIGKDIVVIFIDNPMLEMCSIFQQTPPHNVICVEYT